jgi:hypothetical protein
MYSPARYFLAANDDQRRGKRLQRGGLCWAVHAEAIARVAKNILASILLESSIKKRFSMFVIAVPIP